MRHFLIGAKSKNLRSAYSGYVAEDDLSLQVDELPWNVEKNSDKLNLTEGAIIAETETDYFYSKTPARLNSFDCA